VLHSIEAVIWAGGSIPSALEAEIVETIFDEKAGGIQAYGSTEVVYTDEQSNEHIIGYTEAAAVNILVDITIVVDSATYVGDAVIIDAIDEFIEALPIGNDVFRSAIIAIVEAYQGVLSVTLAAGPLLAIKPAAPAAADISINARQKAMVDAPAADIVVHS
jgi:uncharacterized phage protein gp47/JayE